MRNKKIISIIPLLLLFSCSDNDNLEQHKNNIYVEKKTVGVDTIYNVIKNDTLIYSYYTKHQKPNGFFQSYINGEIFSNGIMIDSMKNGVWKFYNTSGKIDSVNHYYNNDLKFKLDKTDFDIELITMKESGIKIMVPLSWQVRENYNNTLFAINKKTIENGFKANIVLVLDKTDALTFNDYCSNTIKIIASQFLNVKLIEERNIIIDSFNAKEFIFTGNLQDKLIGEVVVIVEHPLGKFVFTAAAGNTVNGDFLKYKNLFEEIINSVSFPKASV